MKSKSVIAVLSLFFGSNLVFAQSNVSKAPTLSELDQDSKTWSVRVDATSLLLKGFGLSFRKSFFNKVNAGLFYAQHSLNSDSAFSSSTSTLGGYSATHQAQEYGLRADIYPFSTFDRGGFYTSLVVAKVDLETTVDPVFSDKTRVLNTNKTGLRLLAGYEFKRGVFKRMSSALNIGGGYGSGGGYANNLGGTYNEITDGIILDAAYSYFF